MGRFISDDDEYEDYINRKLLESVQYKPKEEPTTITLYADNKPYQVIDLKDIDEMSEEEYNDKLKDAWFKKVYHEAVEEATIQKYMNYEVEEEKPEEKENKKILLAFAVISILFWVIVTWIIMALGG